VRRACKISLKFLTAKKRREITALLQAYRAAVNFYIKSLWATKGKLDKETLARLPKENTRLSERYKSQALKQALETVIATKLACKATKKWAAVPIFNGSATLDAKFVQIEEGKGSFDLCVRLSSLRKEKKIHILSRKTKVLNKWTGKPLAKIIQGCSLSEHSLVIWVELPELLNKTEGIDLGLDIGVNKILSLSDGTHLGTEFKELRKKIQRKQSGSKGKKRALAERNNYIRRVVSQLPWQKIKFLAIEDLKGLKKGKNSKRGKSFRKALIPWTYRQVIAVLKNKAQENRVYLVLVAPAYTSQTCPKCGKVAKGNRKAERFQCLDCGFGADADHVGAMNILAKGKGLRLVGSLESPTPIDRYS
jgi:IS605 OrfB family transposase